MTEEQIVERARSQIGKMITYRLGAGDITVNDDSPADEYNACDCSAFVCWCLKLNKYQPFRWLKEINGGWYNTAGIWWDAVMEHTGFFEPIAMPKAGNLIVYPPRYIVNRVIETGHIMSAAGTPNIGHVGIISAVGSDEISVTKVIHCSKGNYLKFGDAVAETDAKVFSKPTVRFVRFA